MGRRPPDLSEKVAVAIAAYAWLAIAVWELVSPHTVPLVARVAFFAAWVAVDGWLLLVAARNANRLVLVLLGPLAVCIAVPVALARPAP